MGGVTSNCNKNYSDRTTYSNKHSTQPPPTPRGVATLAGSSNNNKPEVVRASASRNRSASVGDDVTGSRARMATNRRPTPQDGGAAVKTPEESRRGDVCTWSMRTAAGNNMAAIRSSGGVGGWGSGRMNPSRNNSLRSDTSRSSSPRYNTTGGGIDSPGGSGSRNAGSFRGRCYWGSSVQRNSDTQLDFTGTDVTVTPTSSSPHKMATGSAAAAAAPPRGRSTQRRSSISFLPAEASIRESALGLLPVGSSSSRGGAVSPMEKVNFSLGNATDLVASLIGGTVGGGGGQNSQSKHEDSFWVPPAVWRKKRAQSLVPQRPSIEDDVMHETGVRRIPSASNSMQEMSAEFPVPAEVGGPLPVSVGQASDGGGQPQPPGGGVGGGGGARRRRASMQDALDFSKINASLYERPPLVSQMFGSIQEENCGSLNLSISYETELSLLTVHLIRAQDLGVPPAGPRDPTAAAVSSSRPGGLPSVDPYCQLTILPDRKRHFQTRVQRRTTNPEFDEEFVFDVPQAKLAESAVELVLFDGSETGGGPGECLGTVQVPLDEISLTERVWMWKGISPFVKDVSERNVVGELMLSMTYLSSAERLTVVITKARNLRHTDDGKNATASANPFVRVSLVSGGKRTKKKRTSTKRNTLSPVWNEALVFNLQAGREQLASIQLEIGVFNDNYLLGNSDLMGKLVLGSDLPPGDCLSHWLELVNNRNAPARWHQLHHHGQDQ